MAFGLRSALIPIAIGIALLLAAVAIAKASRAGLVLGQAVAVLMALAGIAFVVIELPYLAQGGMSAAFAGPFMAAAVIWSAGWAVYGWRISKARSGFAPAWQPPDRRLGILLAVLVLAAGGGWLGLGSAEQQAAVDFDAAYEAAERYINGTGLAVAVVDVELDEATSSDPAPVVERLVLDLTLGAARAYPLIDAPRLCLVDRATAEDPIYKQSIICWGTDGSALVLDADFADLGVQEGDRTIRITLDRGLSPCAFRAGTWSAALTLAPRTLTVETDDLSPWPQSFTIDATFDVPADATGALPSPAVGEPREDCLGVSP